MNPSAKSREWEFFRDESGRIAFNPKCNECAKNCKQSFRAELVRCPVFVKKNSSIKRTPKQAVENDEDVW